MAESSGQMNPLLVHRFGVEIDGKLQQGFFTGIKGIRWAHDVVETRVNSAGGMEPVTRKQSGRGQWSPITLTAAVTTSVDFNAWIKETEDGQVEAARTNCSLVAFDQSNTEVARWNLTNAWISNVDYTTLNSQGQDVQYEVLTLQHEGIERVS